MLSSSVANIVKSNAKSPNLLQNDKGPAKKKRKRIVAQSDSSDEELITSKDAISDAEDIGNSTKEEEDSVESEKKKDTTKDDIKEDNDENVKEIEENLKESMAEVQQDEKMEGGKSKTIMANFFGI